MQIMDFSKPKNSLCFQNNSLIHSLENIHLLRLNSGVIKQMIFLYNYHRDFEEKVGKLYVLRGNKVRRSQRITWQVI